MIHSKSHASIIALALAFGLIGCSDGSSQRLDAGTGGSSAGNGGTRTGGSSGMRATGGAVGSGGRTASGSGGTSMGGTGGSIRDGGMEGKDAGGFILDGGVDRSANPDGAVDRADVRIDVALDAPMDGGRPEVVGIDTAITIDTPAIDSVAVSPCGVCPTGLSCGGGGTPDRCGTVAVLTPGTFRSPDGWFFANNKPQGNNLQSVYAIATDDIWAVGMAGTILHFDGTAWAGVTGLFEELGANRNYSGSPVEGFNLVNFYSVWASGPADIWIAGSTGSGGTGSGSTESPLLMHGDGTRWERVVVPGATAKYFSGVSGSAANDVWVAGYAGNTAHHFDGTFWTTTLLPNNARYAGGVWSASSTEAYLATDSGLFQWDGTAWRSTTLTARLEGVWGAPGAGKWAWGSSTWHLIGTTWIDMGSACSGPVWGTSETSMWQAECHFDGTAWNTIADAKGIKGIHGPKGGGAVGVSTNGLPFDLSTTTVTPAYVDDPALTGDYVDIQSRAANDVWIVGAATGPTGTGQVGRVVHWDGQAYTAYDEDAVTLFSSVGVGADGTVLLGSAKGPFTLSAGTFASTPGATSIRFEEMWVASSDAAWALTRSNAVIYFYDGTAWKTVPHALSAANVQLKDVWGIGRDDVWAVGTNGMTLHWNGATWTPIATASASANLVGVWGIDATHVWAVAEDGTMLAWDGSQWTAAAALPGNTGNLHGCSATEIWAGANGSGGPTLRHFDGTQWRGSNTGAKTFYNYGRVWCAAANEAWLLTSDAVLRRVKTP